MENGISKICLAGGCALNVIANKKIREIGYLDQVYIQPASNDSGIALGAAYMMSSELGYRINPLKMFITAHNITMNTSIGF